MSISTGTGTLLPQNKSAKSDHLPSLDGLRAISIALVLLGHLSATRGFVRLDLGIGDYAHLGVVVFFVISGFLITRLPAAYAFIACVGLLWWAGIVHLQPRDFWHAVTYTTNYLPGRSWQFGHLCPFPSRSSFT